MKAYLCALFASLLLFACSSTNKLRSVDDDRFLAELIATEHLFRSQNDPLSYPEFADNNTKLPDLSPQKLADNIVQVQNLYQQLQRIVVERLSEQNQINHAILSYNLKNEIDSYHFNEHYMPLTAESGFHADISFIGQQVRFQNVKDYQGYLSRLAALPKYFAQQTYWMKQGLKHGITQPSVVLTGFEQSIQAFIKPTAEQSVFYHPFLTFPSMIDRATQNELRQQAKQVITEAVFSSYQQFYRFMVEQYMPNARTEIAAKHLPNGTEYYQNRVDYYTTLTMPVEQIHQLGLQEVARIRQQMMKIIDQVEFNGSFSEFIEYLRTDPQFYATTPEQLLKEAAFIAKQMDGKLPSLFKTLPRNPYTIEPVPANIAPKYTTGRYSPPAQEEQAGSYWVNTYRLDRRPLYVLEALTFHEAVPGHHLQGAIAREMNDVPDFRKNSYISAFGEGWALYSEYLGIEAGFYQNPYSQFGRLTYEMWRACRLVIDTGIHSQGWSRQQAIDYLSANTALSLHNVQTEIDRYISWPGQALSYKMGELTIKAIRAQAEAELGSGFDIRAFHDQILKNGTMPLTMLKQLMSNYITQKNTERMVAKPAK